MMKKIFGLTALALFASLSLSADIYIRTRTHADAMSVMGQDQPARDDVSEQWIGDGVFVNITGQMSTIFDLKKNLVTFVIHGSKAYVQSTLPLDMIKLLPDEAAAMAGMMSMSATVSPTTETKKIGSWNCRGYDVSESMMGVPMQMKIWASTEVPFDADDYNVKIWGNMLASTMMDAASVKEMLKIKGYMIASEISGDIIGAKFYATTEVLEISKKDPPAHVYEVPAGYTKKDKLSVDDLQRR